MAKKKGVLSDIYVPRYNAFVGYMQGVRNGHLIEMAFHCLCFIFLTGTVINSRSDHVIHVLSFWQSDELITWKADLRPSDKSWVIVRFTDIGYIMKLKSTRDVKIHLLRSFLSRYGQLYDAFWCISFISENLSFVDFSTFF